MRAKIIMIIITVRDCNMHACKYVQLKGTEALMEEASSLREPIPSFPDGIQFGSRVSLNWIGEGTLARFYFEVNEIDDMLKEPHKVG